MVQCIKTRFRLEKRGNKAKEFEDAYASKVVQHLARDYFCRVAISDGAAECSFAAEWAKILTRSYRDQPFKDLQDIQARVDALSKHWHSIAFRRPLQWFAEEKARMGAFATLLGLELSFLSGEQTSSGHWRIVVIGDSCLFQIRDDALKLAFPIHRSCDFNNSPVLLSSNLSMNRAVWEKVLFLDGEWQVGDTFVLATDALSAWFLHSCEQNERPWNAILSFLTANKPQVVFAEWVEQKRLSGMRNDDVTIYIIQLVEK